MPGQAQSEGTQTVHGLAGLVVAAALLVLLFHFIGLRVIFVAGRSVA